MKKRRNTLIRNLTPVKLDNLMPNKTVTGGRSAAIFGMNAPQNGAGKQSRSSR